MSTSVTRRKLQDPRVVRRLAAALLAGATLTEALSRIGVSRSTFYRELRRSPDLRALSTNDKPPTAQTSPKDSPTAAKRKAARKPAVEPPAASRGHKAPAKHAAQVAQPVAEPKRKTKRQPGARAASTADKVAPPRKRKSASPPAKPQRPAPKAKRRAGARPTTTPETTTPETTTPATQPPIAAAAATAEPADLGQPPSVEVRVEPAVHPPTRLSTLVRNPYTITGPIRDRAGAAIAIARGRAQRRPHPWAAPSSGDWMPPAAVLGLQLIVAIAVGAHPLVLLLIALSTVGVLVAVRRARQLAPKTVPEEDVRFTSRVVGPVLLEAGANGDTQDPVAGERRSMDLRWVAATILPAGSTPDDPTPPRTHG